MINPNLIQNPALKFSFDKNKANAKDDEQAKNSAKKPSPPASQGNDSQKNPKSVNS